MQKLPIAPLYESDVAAGNDKSLKTVGSKDVKVAVSKDGKYIAVSHSRAARVRTYEVSTWTKIGDFPTEFATEGYSYEAPVCFVGPSNNLLFTTNDRRYLQEMTLHGLQVRRLNKGDWGCGQDVSCIDGNGEMVVLGTAAYVYVGCYPTGEYVNRFYHISRVDAIKLPSSHEKIIITCSFNTPSCWVYSVYGVLLRAITLDFYPQDVCFSMLDNVVVSGNNSISFFYGKGCEVANIDIVGKRIRSIAYSSGKVFVFDVVLQQVHVFPFGWV